MRSAWQEELVWRYLQLCLKFIIAEGLLHFTQILLQVESQNLNPKYSIRLEATLLAVQCWKSCSSTLTCSTFQSSLYKLIGKCLSGLPQAEEWASYIYIWFLCVPKCLRWTPLLSYAQFNTIMQNVFNNIGFVFTLAKCIYGWFRPLNFCLQSHKCIYNNYFILVMFCPCYKGIISVLLSMADIVDQRRLEGFAPGFPVALSSCLEWMSW